MEQPPHIATELLEIIVNELGAEAETLPSSSEAFQALLNLSLTGPRARPLCEQYLFAALTFDDPQHKVCPNATPAWKHLRTTIELFDVKPHLASYVRYLQISFALHFPRTSS